MKYKPITAGAHGLTDYAFGFALITLPALLGADKKIVLFYRLMAVQIFMYSGLSKQPYALKALIPLSVHRKIDIGNLAGLSLFTGVAGIYKDKRVLLFHLGMTALGLINILFTNWKIIDKNYLIKFQEYGKFKCRT